MDRRYIPKKRGGRGLISGKDAVNCEKRGLGRYLQQSREELLKVVYQTSTNIVDEGAMKYKQREEERRMPDLICVEGACVI